MTYYRYDGTPVVESATSVSQQYQSGVVETLTGGAAPDGLWGGDNDTLIGGPSDDTFYLHATSVHVIDNGGGVDSIVAWANTDLANTPQVQNLTVGGDHTYAAGNSLDNLIVADGTNQNLYGGGGNDVLVGGSGVDTFIVVKGQGNDAIYNFNPAQDVIRLSAGYTNFAQVQPHLTQVGADVKLDMGGGDGLILRNTTVSQLTAANFQLQLDTSKLGALTFDDEFNGPLSIWNAQYNPTGTWRPDFGYQGAQGVGSYTELSNGEQEIYTSPYFRGSAGNFAESPFVSNANGTLTIVAQPSSNPQIFGYHYTSGMISTAPSFAQTYGYFEMRAELPTTPGAWPAFWLIPEDGSWPPELDVMETLSNDPNADYTTAHSSIGGNTQSQAISFVPPTASGYHTYGVLWTQSTLTWYVDGVQVFQTATPADMNKPMYMIANLALGGWGGGIDNSQLPADMNIDYIRAYALPDGSSVTTLDTVIPSAVGSGASSGGGTSSGATSGGTTTPPPVTSGGGGSGGGSGGSAATGLNLVGHAGGDTLSGAAGDDSLTGSSGHNYIRGNAGNDSITGGSDFNDINGNQGDDTIVGHSTVGDWLVGGQGNDSVSAVSSAHNILYGNLGDDTLVAGSGGDTVRGGQGNDLLIGGSGNDWLSGDRGQDTIQGGSGQETFHTAPGMGVTTVTGWHAGDHVQLDVGSNPTITQSGANVLIDLGGGTQMVLQNTQLGSLASGWLVYA